MPALWSVLRFMLKSIGYLSVVLAGLTLGTIYFFQGKAIYPSAYPEGSLTKVSLPTEFEIDDYEDLTLETSDGEKLKAYLLWTSDDKGPAKKQPIPNRKFAKTRPTVLFFHANAGNMGHRLPIAKVLVQQAKMNVLMLSYRGYGLSTGTPTENGLKIDAQTALDYVTNHPVLGGTPIVFYGASLGGAVAINLAAANPNIPAAMILENTFLSIKSLIPTLVPGLRPLTFLLHQHWNSDERLAQVPADLPILLLSGAKDEIVPASQMIQLKKIANSRRKTPNSKGPIKSQTTFKLFDRGTHNETVSQPDYFQTLVKFVEDTVMRSSTGKRLGTDVGRGARFL